MLSVFLSLTLLLATDPAAPPPAEPPKKTQAEKDKEKVCITVVPTGSVIGKQVCKTRKQWRRLQEAERRQAEGLLDTGGSDRQGRE